MSNSKSPTTMWKAGDHIDFDNGGSVIVHWTDDEWIGFSTHLKGRWDDPILRRMTPEDFDASLQITRDKIVKGAAT